MSLHTLMFVLVIVGAVCKILWLAYKYVSSNHKPQSFAAKVANAHRHNEQDMDVPIAPAHLAGAFGLSLAADSVESDEPEWQQYYGTSADWA